MESLYSWTSIKIESVENCKLASIPTTNARVSRPTIF